MQKYFNFLYACVNAALVVAFFTIGVANSNAVMASIVCYYLAAAAVLMLAGISMSTVTSNLSSAIFKMRPYLSIFGILMFSAILMSIYFDPISGNKVSDYYYNFSKVSIILVIIQIAVFFHSIFGANHQVDALSRKTLSVLGLLATINIITLLTLAITLKYYTTDC